MSSRLHMLSVPWLGALLLGAATVRGESIPWLTDVDQAFALAQQTQRPLLVEFTSPSCGWCKEAAKYMHPDPDVVRQVEAGFVPLQITGLGGELAKRFEARGTPHTLVLTPTGDTLVLRIRGYHTPHLYLYELAHAARRLEDLQTNAEAFNLLTQAEAAWKENDGSRALNLAEQALALHPAFVDAVHLRAKVYAANDQLDLALEAYDQAVALDPNDPWVRHERGLIHHRRHDLGRAIADLEASAALQPRGATYTLTRLWVLMTFHNQRDAADAILRANIKRANAERADWWHGLCARYALGDVDEERMLKFATQPYRKVQAHYLIAVRALSEGRRDEAIGHLRAAVGARYEKVYDFRMARCDLARLEAQQP